MCMCHEEFNANTVFFLLKMMFVVSLLCLFQHKTVVQSVHVSSFLAEKNDEKCLQTIIKRWITSPAQKTTINVL